MPPHMLSYKICKCRFQSMGKEKKNTPPEDVLGV